MKLYKVRFKRANFLFFITIAALSTSCGDSEVDPVTGRSSEFESVPQKFPITPGVINEASGLAGSFTMNGYIWTLLDSGNPNALYLLSTDGKTVKEFNVPGSTNHDWEAIASGPGPVDGTNYLYIGEIGNNNPPMTTTNIIYRIPEIGDISGSFGQDKLEKITFSYPDGPRDAETLLLDPVTKDLFVISKELDKANIYRLAYPQSTSATITAEKIGTIPSVVFTTDGSISYDGNEILIRNYTSVFYWQRKSGETIGQTLLQAPKKTLITAPEPQAEGITFDREGKGFYTLGEIGQAKSVSLSYYLRK
ncbi:PE-PGRS family protein [Dyadobacter subterraneus]|uniref:PE-PGRS family protein n=1 Tax=Dyadobacter subterraneus TaxID=2773304 RepID=A0ABR9WHX5_9BACT|nr:PE-PGRS family protein [Dyadobacter subterraneus]MBE9465017.1 PE-PGRS family protein [Dyadobacter subterraneus]